MDHDDRDWSNGYDVWLLEQDDIGAGLRLIRHLIGEEFLEHGRSRHVSGVFEESVRVPLVVALPGHVGDDARIGTPVETRSVFPTVLEAVGIDFGFRSRPPPLLSLDGPDGRRRGRTTAPSFSSTWMPDVAAPTGERFELVSVRDGRWKPIVDRTRESSFLFDLDADPVETEDRYEDEPEIARPPRALGYL